MLAAIVREKYKDVAAIKAEQPLIDWQGQLTVGTHRFKAALTARPWALIAECKKASPAKGVFPHNKEVGELAAIYANNGADTLSVLTDKHFNGTLADIAAAQAVCDLPILRKDFVIDSYQIYEARRVKADAVLLIAAILTDEQLCTYLEVAHSLGMDCLVEVHTQEELERVLRTPAEIIGINNRDLKSFVTDIRTTEKLMPLCAGRFVISESGVRTADDAQLLQAWGAKGILVGEGLVTAPDIALRTRELALC